MREPKAIISFSNCASRKKTFAALTENWGRQPLLKVGRGHYGLGLHRVRAIVEAHQGQLQARYVSATLFLCTRRSRCRCPRDGGVGGSIKCLAL